MQIYAAHAFLSESSKEMPLLLCNTNMKKTLP